MADVIKNNKLTKPFFALCVMCLFAGLIFAQTQGRMGLSDSRDGKIYRIVRMPDGKTWFAQNLDFETYEGSWCYDDNPANCEIYGRLYDWETALTVCPAGWRLPRDEDWTALENAVGGRATAGTRLKSSSGWAGEGNGTDDFGFSALPGGSRLRGVFLDVGLVGRWWSAIESGTALARYRRMSYDYESVSWDSSEKSNALSVRCVLE